MKALSLIQPWATLVASGAKTIETRSWPTDYRGELAIHAAKAMPLWARDLCRTEPFRSALRAGAAEWGETASDPLLSLPLGAVVAVARLVDCYQITADNAPRGGNEPVYGDYTPGRWAWVFSPVVRLAVPAPASGARGLWEWKAPLPVVMALRAGVRGE